MHVAESLCPLCVSYKEVTTVPSAAAAAAAIHCLDNTDRANLAIQASELRATILRQRGEETAVLNLRNKEVSVVRLYVYSFPATGARFRHEQVCSLTHCGYPSFNLYIIYSTAIDL